MFPCPPIPSPAPEPVAAAPQAPSWQFLYESDVLCDSRCPGYWTLYSAVSAGQIRARMETQPEFEARRERDFRSFLLLPDYRRVLHAGDVATWLDSVGGMKR